MNYASLLSVLFAAQVQQPLALPSSTAPPQVRPVATVVPNDNRTPGGTLRRGTLHLSLEARTATWRPDHDVDSALTVMAFAEPGQAPRIPGPLMRATEGTDVVVTLRNTLGSAIVVRGLRAGALADDTVHLAAGGSREVRFRAGRPGTYLYWGSTQASEIADRPLRDSQLTGAIVIDPRGARPDTAERILVMTVVDYAPFDTARNTTKEDIWELAINGLSWPWTERFEHAVGDTVRWRWVNGSYLPHPMHLHGFHFRVLAKGDGYRDTPRAPDAIPQVVTELMNPGSTFQMTWVPTRAGHWLMHCHMTPHITPFPERTDSTRGHDVHDVEKHALTGMAGLVLGISTVERGGMVAEKPRPVRHMRLFAQQARADSGKPVARGFVMQRGTTPRADSVEVPGSPLVLTRGETVAITVVNRLDEPTTVHWHGMELESVFDGVAGWSRSGSAMAPLLAPGDSFAVTFTPPNAGTYMYHTHMDESRQLSTGMYGPLLVLEPGEPYDPATDLVMMVGQAVVRDTVKISLNGERDPAPLMLRAGTRYRMRFINILGAPIARVALTADSIPVTWRAISKDGVALPAGLAATGPAILPRLGVGETYDFEWTPAGPMDAVLEIRTEGAPIRRVVQVR